MNKFIFNFLKHYRNEISHINTAFFFFFSKFHIISIIHLKFVFLHFKIKLKIWKLIHIKIYEKTVLIWIWIFNFFWNWFLFFYILYSFFYEIIFKIIKHSRSNLKPIGFLLPFISFSFFFFLVCMRKTKVKPVKQVMLWNWKIK